MYAGVALAHGWPAFAALFALYGLYAASTEGVAKAWLSNLTDRTDTGAALGTFSGLSSLAALLASLGAGALWQWAGPAWTFGLAAVAALGVATYLARAQFVPEN